LGLAVLGTVLEVHISSQACQQELETGCQAWEMKKLYPDRAPIRHRETLGCF
jgi:hypothetical protein